VDHDPLRRTLLQDSKDVRPCVADVDDERLAALPGEVDVEPEDTLLILGRRAHAEVVEPGLPHPDAPGVVEHLLELRPHAEVEGRGVVGMQAGRGEHPAQGVGQFEAPAARRDVHPHADQAVDAGGLRSLHRCWRFAVQEEQVAVGVHRPGLHRHLKVLVVHPGPSLAGLHLRSTRGASRETRS
jgi:hypothetical protein